MIISSIAMYLFRKPKVSVSSFYILNGDRVQLILIIEKHIQLRHTYLKAKAFLITSGLSYSTRVFVLTVFIAY